MRHSTCSNGSSSRLGVAVAVRRAVAGPQHLLERFEFETAVSAASSAALPTPQHLLERFEFETNVKMSALESPNAMPQHLLERLEFETTAAKHVRAVEPTAPAWAVRA